MIICAILRVYRLTAFGRGWKKARKRLMTADVAQSLTRASLRHAHAQDVKAISLAMFHLDLAVVVSSH